MGPHGIYRRTVRHIGEKSWDRRARRQHRVRRYFLMLAAWLFALGCSSPGASSQSAAGAPPSAPSSARVEKRITIGTIFEQDPRPTSPGMARVILPLINSGLSIVDGHGARHALLAEEIP